MVTVGLLVPLKAKPGKEADVERFLEGGLALVDEEPGTTAWFAIRLGPSEFAIVDFFADDAGRQAHLSGRVAEALMARASDLFAEPTSGPPTSSPPSSPPELRLRVVPSIRPRG
jgi:quinol monooxygenase YgiN